MKIYFAGPLFTLAEIMFNAALAKRLRDYGYEVFLPQELDQSSADLNAIYQSDRKGVEACDMILGNLDGADSDSGTCWELGYAKALGKKVMVYRTDFRVGKVDMVNLMMTESADVVIHLPFTNLDGLAARIHTEIIQSNFRDAAMIEWKGDQLPKDPLGAR